MIGSESIVGKFEGTVDGGKLRGEDGFGGELGTAEGGSGDGLLMSCSSCVGIISVGLGEGRVVTLITRSVGAEVGAIDRPEGSDFGGMVVGFFACLSVVDGVGRPLSSQVGGSGIGASLGDAVGTKIVCVGSS